MAKTLQFRRGTTSELSSITGSVGELFVNTEKDTVVVMDGSTSGGFELVNLNASQTLTNKTLTSPVISTISNTGTLTLPTSTGTIALTSDIPTNNNALTNGAGYITATSTDTLTNKTFDANGTGNSISNIEAADFAAGIIETDLATSITTTDDTFASAKAIKTYVDDQVTAQDFDLTADTGSASIDLDSESLQVTGGTGIDTTVDNLTKQLTIDIDSTIVTTNSGTQTLTNKTLGATTIAGHLIPDTDVTYDLGSSSFKFRDIYLSGTSINLGDATITASGSSIVLPAGTTVSGGSGATVDLNSTQTLTNKTLTSPTITGTGAIAGIFTGNITGDVTGNADTATTLETARTIGGVSFDGSANINLPGVNTTGNQDTSGNAATATALETARTIAGQSFDGTANITIASTDLSNTSNITLNDATQTLTNKTISGSSNTISNIGNSSLVNDTVTVGTTDIALGASATDINGLTSLDVDNITINGNTISSSDTNGNVVIDPNGTGVVDVNTSRITNVSDPVNDNDAANKAYVDAVAEGLHVHEQVHALITTPLATITGDTVTYDNGTSGVGATLTLSTALDIAGGDLDGDTDITTGDRIIINGESTAAHNGIYVVTSTTVLTRATDFDTPTEMAGGDFVWVTHGTTYADTGWVLGEPVGTVGTNDVSFVQFSGLGQITAGDALTKTGNTLDVAVDDSTIEVSSDALQVKNAGITSDQLATNAVTTLKITDGNVTAGKLASTLDLSGNTITLPSSFTTNSGTQTLTNKTLTSPVISTISNTGTLTLPTSTGTVALTSDIPTNNNQLTNGAGYLTSFTETNDLTASVTWADVPNANITQSSVTQHQAALSITESQISDLGSYITASSSDTLTNKTLDDATLTGTLTAGGGVGTAGQVLKSTGTGVEWGTGGSGATALGDLTDVQGNSGAYEIFQDGVLRWDDTGEEWSPSPLKTINGNTLLGSGNITITSYTDSDVDTHLNTSSATTNQVLSWTGSDYDWVDQSGSALTVQDEGSTLSTSATTLNFVGSGVTASGTGSTKTITISGGGSGDLSAIAEDILPSFDEIYDIGSSTYKWYDGFFTNSINLDTIALTNSSGTLSINSDVTVGSLLVDSLLLSENTITSDASTALQYLGDKGIVEINNSNLDVREGDWIGVPVVETTTTTTSTTTEVVDFTLEQDWSDGSWLNDTSFEISWYSGSGYVSSDDLVLNTLEAGDILELEGFYNFEAYKVRVTYVSTTNGPLTENDTGTNITINFSNVTSIVGEIPSLNASVQSIKRISEEESTSSTTTPPLTTGVEGIIRYNKDESRFEGYNSEGWASLGGLEKDADGNNTVAGNLVVSGDITSTSDETLKENIKSIEGALDTVTKLSGKMFTMKSDETQKEKVGFIAQEIEQHLPQVVSTDPNGIKSVSYGNVAALLVEAIKELNQKIEDLKK